MNTYEYILLNSICISRNRNRAYALTFTQSTAKADIFIVRQSWGRRDYYKNEKLTYFEDMKEAHKYLHGLLKLRMKHGYMITSMTKSFPEDTIPEGLVRAKISIQLSLFSDMLAA